MERNIPGNATAKRAGADLVKDVPTAVQCMDTTTIGDAMLSVALLVAVKCSAVSAKMYMLRFR